MRDVLSGKKGRRRESRWSWQPAEPAGAGSADSGRGRRGHLAPAVAHEQRGEARRIGRVEVGDPIVKLEDEQDREAPRRTANYRRQHISPVALGARLAAVVARVGVLVLAGVLRVAARVGAASVADVDGALLDAVAGPSISCTPVNGVLVVEAAAGRVELHELVAHVGGGDVLLVDEGVEQLRGRRRRRRRVCLAEGRCRPRTANSGQQMGLALGCWFALKLKTAREVALIAVAGCMLDG